MSFPFDFVPNVGIGSSSAQGSDYNGSQPDFRVSQNFSLQTPTVPVENLSLSEVMKNPHVQRMYNTLQEATDKVMQGVQIQQTLYQENSRLAAEVKELHMLHPDNV